MVREQSISCSISQLLVAQASEKRSDLKYSVAVRVHMTLTNGKAVDEVVSFFRSGNRQLYKGNDVSASLNKINREQNERIDKIFEEGSG